MTLEQFYRYQEESFDSFCKTIIRNESASIQKKMNVISENEVPFSCVPDEALNALFTVDIYSTYCQSFSVGDYTVRVHDPLLGKMLQHISPHRRDVILMAYFLGFNDAEIGRQMHIDRKTAGYRRTEALRKLKELLEEQNYV